MIRTIPGKTFTVSPLEGHRKTAGRPRRRFSSTSNRNAYNAISDTLFVHGLAHVSLPPTHPPTSTGDSPQNDDQLQAHAANAILTRDLNIRLYRQRLARTFTAGRRRETECCAFVAPSRSMIRHRNNVTHYVTPVPTIGPIVGTGFANMKHYSRKLGVMKGKNKVGPDLEAHEDVNDFRIPSKDNFASRQS